MSDFAIKRMDEMPASFGGGFVLARHALGVQSFGMQVVRIPAGLGDRYPEHDHAHDGQEEVFVPLKGSGEIVIDGESHALEPGVFVRVGPAPRRRLAPGPEGLEILVLGGVPGKAYEPSPNSVPQE
jgi:mannose-6-phosphate isomerase-like protein (cupin superfamily)